MAEWQLVRKPSGKTCTLGKLSINGVYRCSTIERVNDGKNTPNRSAIPEGRYKLEKRWSPHFNRIVLAVLNVPNRSDIEIHAANFSWELKGCIAVGEPTGYNSVCNSEHTLDGLLEEFSEPTWLTIESTLPTLEKV